MSLILVFGNLLYGIEAKRILIKNCHTEVHRNAFSPRLLYDTEGRCIDHVRSTEPMIVLYLYRNNETSRILSKLSFQRNRIETSIIYSLLCHLAM